MTRPTIRERAAATTCPNCGKPSPERKSNRGPAPLYCDKKCKREMGNRNLVEGAPLVPFLKAWRANRGTGPVAKASFARVCKILDAMNSADRKDNRPAPVHYASYLLRSDAQPTEDLRSARRRRAYHASLGQHMVMVTIRQTTREEIVSAESKDHAIRAAKSRYGTPHVEYVGPVETEYQNDTPAIEAPAAESTESTPDLADILKMIADGHNDARALAEQALAAIGK